MLILQLNVLTLNIWGIPFVSSDREKRVNAIADELKSGNYDIVSLQEVWSQEDYLLLKEQTKETLPHSHYFYSGVIGAGLLVLSKYPIINTLFHAWSVNGYFHRVQHADWFGGKGVGLCKILIGDRIVHLYNAHLHAEYDNDNDEYKTHRVIQAFDTAQFIEATRGESVLQILAGDLNTKPQDTPYKMLLSVSRMHDCCISDTISTNECHRNSYTAKHVLNRNPHGIRIDHIFIRTANDMEAHVIDYTLPFPDRVPGQKFSFSDHEAVLARLELRAHRSGGAPTTDTRNEDSSENSVCSARAAANNLNAAGGEPVVAAAFRKFNEMQCIKESDKANSVVNRLSALREAIALSDSSLEQLKADRILYYTCSAILLFLLIALTEYPVPRGFKTLYLIFKFLLFGIILFCAFMGSIWNYMERNGILSGKTSMEIMEINIEKYENPTKTR